MSNHIEMEYICFLLNDDSLDVFFKNEFNAKNDAELINKVIRENKNPNIIIKLIEIRSPNQRQEIKSEYKKLFSERNLLDDILNYFPDIMKNHIINLLIETENIIFLNENVKNILNTISFDKYLENEFDVSNDVKLINEVIKRNDNSLIIVRLLNYRNETQRQLINDKYKETRLEQNQNLFQYIKNFMLNHVEMEYICFLLSGIKY